jgi:hypothetical protein
MTEAIPQAVQSGVCFLDRLIGGMQVKLLVVNVGTIFFSSSPHDPDNASQL